MRIDLRSDTVTRPTKEMKQAMMDAPLGDDVFQEDPTIIQLETHAAGLFGQEAAIFCPSGTMTNQIAIRIHTMPGSEVICHKDAHIYQYEGGGIAVNSLSSIYLLEGNRGRIRAKDVVNAIQPDDIHKPVTSMISIEDTSNRGGGCVYDMEDIRQIRGISLQSGLPLHCDGARLFNALIKRGMSTADYGKYFDTISICLSKGLGAPVGSLLLGSTEKIHMARRVRKVLGGGMRQAGILAAAGLYALEHHVDRLAEDHRRAAEIGEHLKNRAFIKEILPVETNIVVFKLQDNIDPKQFLQTLQEHDVLAVLFGGQAIRFVTHLDFTDDHLATLLEILNKIDQ